LIHPAKHVSEVETAENYSAGIGRIRDIIWKAVGAVNLLIGNVGASSAVRVISLKAGIMVALEFLIANLLKKGERK